MIKFNDIIIKVKYGDDKNSSYFLTQGRFDNRWLIKIKDEYIPIYLGYIYCKNRDINLLESISIFQKGSTTIKNIRNITKDVKKLIYMRHIYHLEFERVLKYAIDSSKLAIDGDLYSNLLNKSNRFDFNIFSSIFTGFASFLDKSRNLDIMIAGSSVLYSFCSKIKREYWKPHDVDIYINYNADQKKTLLGIDKVIRDVYNGLKIKIVRSPYVLTYFVLRMCDQTRREIVEVQYQIILSPCKRWEHVFAGYHSDIVCAGYLCKEQQFVTSIRFEYWATNDKPAYFFPDLVSPRYRDRVSNAYIKYNNRDFDVVLVGEFDELKMMDIERSPKLDDIMSGTHDIAPYLQNIEGIQSIGDTLQEVYYGEAFQSIIETMSCFRSCPVCGTLVFCAEKALYCEMLNDTKDMDSGCFCNNCFKKEISNLELLNHTLKNKLDKKAFALVTGGRCGLGKEVMNLLSQCNVNTIGTTRFPTDDKLIKLDLKDSSTWKDAKFLLESGAVNILVLSASETLHYPDDDILSENWNKEKDTPKDTDWTNDFQRKNSGVWHKTLERHTYNEIMSPLIANVGGNASLLGFFLNGVRKIRAEESMGNKTNKKFFCCIAVTSYEGTFEAKTPVHPITNACKSALEQIVWSVKEQADFLECKVLLSDPGWVYTEGTFGKFKGPVPIKFGACQILQPLVSSLNFHNVLNAKIFRRERTKTVDNFILFDDKAKTSVKIKLEPCNHVVDISDNPNFLIKCCPICNKCVDVRNLVDYRPQKTFLDAIEKYKVPKRIIDIILVMADFPPIEEYEINHVLLKDCNLIKEPEPEIIEHGSIYDFLDD